MSCCINYLYGNYDTFPRITFEVEPDNKDHKVIQYLPDENTRYIYQNYSEQFIKKDTWVKYDSKTGTYSYEIPKFNLERVINNGISR